MHSLSWYRLCKLDPFGRSFYYGNALFPKRVGPFARSFYYGNALFPKRVGICNGKAA